MIVLSCGPDRHECDERKTYYLYVAESQLKLAEKYDERLRQLIIGVLGPVDSEQCTPRCRFFLRALSPGDAPRYEILGGGRQCYQNPGREVHIDLNEEVTLRHKEQGEKLELRLSSTPAAARTHCASAF